MSEEDQIERTEHRQRGMDRNIISEKGTSLPKHPKRILSYGKYIQKFGAYSHVYSIHELSYSHGAIAEKLAVLL